MATRSMAEQREPSITTALQVGVARIERGQRRLNEIAAEMPKDDATLPADVANELRERLFWTAHGFKARSKTIEIEAAAPTLSEGVSASGLMIPAATWEALALALGVPRLRDEWYGDCSTCLYGPDRGYSSPCSGCGYGYPRHTPKCFTPAEIADAERDG